ncbi:MAG TPA: DNA phosphorothioation system sulfurtransferase DndC [Candidatus Poseidoniales archaeon]|nr:MAG TPA: DNA phosphorothioation system sulfurtransferase DndC [Candidatus Poseidoniales archaeon]HII62663.1 DNA phosphorothioation system sulfurtransferase DndC [Candidatus Poseidoniaceae archaeon]|tara:strand:+ start:682 stop:2238 length:1557 start_codon:yes stop_codon:yes gene_type:complete
MATKNKKNSDSAFAVSGIKKHISTLLSEISSLYLADDVPWVIGYSGGKDSTAVLQLVWMAVAALPKSQQNKTVHVITTDTLVENPIVAQWVAGSLACMKKQAKEDQLPFQPHQLKPKPENSFWTNLIGKGYPAPRPKFRWCTERLKIWPSNEFILNTTQKHGNVLLCLGTRKKESAKRAATMQHYEEERSKEHRYGDLEARDKVSPNSQLPNTWVYTPVQDWANDDVWLFLNQYSNPWGYSNQELLGLYSGATEGGECPLVVDTSTPSCGDSRFGCWTCTLVDEDKSMTAMIQNDVDKEWMLPLLEIRKAIDYRQFDMEESDRSLRDFRRMNGRVQLFGDKMKYIPGPYKKEVRERFLRMLLAAQRFIHDEGPDHVRQINLITLDELEEIRRIWVMDKHEIEDSLPGIYEEEIGESYPGKEIRGNQPFDRDDLKILEEVCGNHYQLVRDLINVELKESTQVRRSNLMKNLENSIKRNFYEDEEDALNYARSQQQFKQDKVDEWDRTADEYIQLKIEID